MPLTVGVDVGGTFTDVVAFDGETLVGGKVPTTTDQSIGVMNAVASLELTPGSVFLHGTTAGTNALLEERGARVALVTSQGFEDLIEIGRQARPSLYDPFADRPVPLVPDGLRIGVGDHLDELLASLSELEPEAVAVALIRSFEDSGEELSLASAIAERLGVPVSSGARCLPGIPGIRADRHHRPQCLSVAGGFRIPATSRGQDVGAGSTGHDFRRRLAAVRRRLRAGRSAGPLRARGRGGGRRRDRLGQGPSFGDQLRHGRHLDRRLSDHRRPGTGRNRSEGGGTGEPGSLASRQHHRRRRGEHCLAG